MILQNYKLFRAKCCENLSTSYEQREQFLVSRLRCYKSNALKTFFSDNNSIIMKMVDNKLFTISHWDRKVEINS